MAGDRILRFLTQNVYHVTEFSFFHFSFLGSLLFSCVSYELLSNSLRRMGSD